MIQAANHGEQTTNFVPSAATDEPADPSNPFRPGLPAARAPDALTETLIEPALGGGCDLHPDRAVRHDGWTPDRIRTFLRALAASGCVNDAARAAGMTKQAAYALRSSTRGRAFALAWRAALLLARRRLAGDLLSRALNGNVATVHRDGKLWEERRRFDNRLGLALLARLDRLVEDDDGANVAARFVAEEFDQFLDIVAADGEGAAEFVASRCRLGFRGHAEAKVLERAGNFVATGEGLPEGSEDQDSGLAAFLREALAGPFGQIDDDEDYEDEDEFDDESDGEDETGHADASGDEARASGEDDVGDRR